MIQNTQIDKRKVFVAMSGGVDSSVAAALLIENGYDVTGVTMQICPAKNDDFGKERPCCSLSAIEDAKLVAGQLGIPHFVFNFQDVFKTYVIDYFINEYKSGRTPNPCVRCNKYIKFESLLEKSISLGADYLATGHYARIKHENTNNEWRLLRGVDRKKDQSYALYSLSQYQISKILMPIGELANKDETRRIAQSYGLSVADKHDSQDICFIDDDYMTYMRDNSPDSFKPGSILDTKGNILGKHRGIAFYTIGQRKGIGISFSKPIYVIDINSNDNTITIGSNDDLYSDVLYSADFNWIVNNNLNESIDVTAKIRYNMADAPARLKKIDNNKIELKFLQPQRAITPGQAVVCYNEDMLIGGGTIQKAYLSI